MIIDTRDTNIHDGQCKICQAVQVIPYLQQLSKYSITPLQPNNKEQDPNT